MVAWCEILITAVNFWSPTIKYGIWHFILLHIVPSKWMNGRKSNLGQLGCHHSSPKTNWMLKNSYIWYTQHQNLIKVMTQTTFTIWHSQVFIKPLHTRINMGKDFLVLGAQSPPKALAPVPFPSAIVQCLCPVPLHSALAQIPFPILSIPLFDSYLGTQW